MSEATSPRVRVWDLPTRIFHWLLVTLIICAWVSFQYNDTVGDPELVWHRYNGYAILILLIWRILWGIVGSPASRFVTFLTWPWNALRYGIDLARQRDRHYLGHNPLGSYMILALITLVGGQAIFGLLATEHNYVTWGPLAPLINDEDSEWYSKMHIWMFENVILIFIGLHITANILYRLIKKDQLIEAMIVGTKPAADYDDKAALLDAHGNARAEGTMAGAVVCLVMAIAIFAGTITALGGKLIY